jgi:pimeloyl-ACP methyl ester carboxylesterase
MPVLAIGGEASYGEHVGDAMVALADDEQSVVIPGTGHLVAEDAPEEMLAALTAFLAPYREGSHLLVRGR